MLLIMTCERFLQKPKFTGQLWQIQEYTPMYKTHTILELLVRFNFEILRIMTWDLMKNGMIILFLLVH